MCWQCNAHPPRAIANRGNVVTLKACWHDTNWVQDVQDTGDYARPLESIDRFKRLRMPEAYVVDPLRDAVETLLAPVDVIGPHNMQCDMSLVRVRQRTGRISPNFFT